MMFLSRHIIFALFLTMPFKMSYDDTPTLYKMALQDHILRVEKHITSQSERIDFLHKPVFVINDCSIDLPRKIGSHEVKELKDSVIGDSIEIHAIKLNPLNIDKGNIILVLSDYIVTRDKAETKLFYVGGRRYIFSYNRVNRQYKIEATKSLSF